ncbi:SH3 domain-containing protein [Salinisphaera aquimarina]|uniref:SH3 domain-containing protein n=1 Tax=Salinisphaera aquimarina TaxID=2094031 RepID=A0ABV7EQF5_9GAMM
MSVRRVGWFIVALIVAIAGIAPAVAAEDDAARAAFARGDYEAARSAWQPAARAGDAGALFGLGLLYANGLGVARDPLAAQHWYTMSAERGQAAAQYNLAVMRETGDGVPRDRSQAAFWYGEAARRNLPAAANNLALMTLAGDGVQREPAMAVALLKRANADDRRRLIDALPEAGAITTANLRARPTLEGKRLGRVLTSTPLRVFAQQQDWAQVWRVDNDTVGWVARRLLRGLPEPGGSRVALATLAQGPIMTPAATSPQLRADADAPPRLTTTRQAAPPHTTRLLRNSGWLATIGGDTTGSLQAAMRGTPMRVKVQGLNVREWPSKRAPIETQLRRNDIVRVLETRGDWQRIELPGQPGESWVAGFLLDDNLTPQVVKPKPAADTPSRAPASAPVGQGGG